MMVVKWTFLILFPELYDIRKAAPGGKQLLLDHFEGDSFTKPQSVWLHSHLLL
jgi:hypothetical protein